MKFSQFKIGELFFTGSGEWVVRDKGKTLLVAHHVSNKEGVPLESWLDEDVIFYWYDFNGCYKNKEEVPND